MARAGIVRGRKSLKSDGARCYSPKLSELSTQLEKAYPFLTSISRIIMKLKLGIILLPLRMRTICKILPYVPMLSMTWPVMMMVRMHMPSTLINGPTSCYFAWTCFACVLLISITLPHMFLPRYVEPTGFRPCGLHTSRSE